MSRQKSVTGVSSVDTVIAGAGVTAPRVVVAGGHSAGHIEPTMNFADARGHRPDPGTGRSRPGAHHGHRRLRDERARPHPVRPRGAGQRLPGPGVDHRGRGCERSAATSSSATPRGTSTLLVVALQACGLDPLIVICRCAVARRVVAP
jgi:hypothetical protein